MKNKLQIRPLEPSDFPDWLPLWDGNNMGQRDQALTTETWARLTDKNYPVHGLGAFQDGKLCGLLHYILHPTTGAIEPVCYMQDVYVDPDARGNGIAKTMIRELAQIGREKKWARMYWIAQSDNESAQKLYNNFGQKLDFTLHVLPLS